MKKMFILGPGEGEAVLCSGCTKRFSNRKAEQVADWKGIFFRRVVAECSGGHHS